MQRLQCIRSITRKFMTFCCPASGIIKQRNLTKACAVEPRCSPAAPSAGKPFVCKVQCTSHPVLSPPTGTAVVCAESHATSVALLGCGVLVLLHAVPPHEFLFSLNGLLMAWVYLRYYQVQLLLQAYE